MNIVENSKNLVGSIKELKRSFDHYGEAVNNAISNAARQVNRAGGIFQGLAGKVNRSVEHVQQTQSEFHHQLVMELEALGQDIGHLEQSSEANTRQQIQKMENILKRLQALHGDKQELLKYLRQLTEDLLHSHGRHQRTHERVLASMQTIVEHENENELASAGIRCLWYNNAGCLHYWKGNDEEARKLWKHGMNLIYPMFESAAFRPVDHDEVHLEPDGRVELVMQDWFELAADVTSTRSNHLAFEKKLGISDRKSLQILDEVIKNKQTQLGMEQQVMESVIWPWVENVTMALKQRDIEQIRTLFETSPGAVADHPIYLKIKEVMNARERKWSKVDSFMPCWVNYITDAFNRRDFALIRKHISRIPRTLAAHPFIIRIQGLLKAIEGETKDAYDILQDAYKHIPDSAPIMLELAQLAYRLDRFDDYDRWMALAEKIVPLNSNVLAWRVDRPNYHIA